MQVTYGLDTIVFAFVTAFAGAAALWLWQRLRYGASWLRDRLRKIRSEHASEREAAFTDRVEVVIRTEIAPLFALQEQRMDELAESHRELHDTLVAHLSEETSDVKAIRDELHALRAKIGE